MFPAFYKMTTRGSILLYVATTVLGGMLHPVLHQHATTALNQQPHAACGHLHFQPAAERPLAVATSPIATVSSPPPVCLFCQLLATPQLCQVGTAADRSDDVLDDSLPSTAITQPLQRTSKYHSRAPPEASS